MPLLNGNPASDRDHRFLIDAIQPIHEHSCMIRRGVWALIFALVYVAIPCRSWAISGLVIFGDSLSDVGNVSNQTLGLAPGSSYYQGRYSNGPLWVEQLSLAQGLPAPVRSRAGGNDWAYAGTKTGSGSTNYALFFNFPNIGTQINNYLNARTPGLDEMFVVWGGGNDFIGGQTNASVPVSNIVNHITTLANAGATQFLVPNLPPLGETPRFVGTTNRSVMNTRSSQFNAQLATSLLSLETSLNVQIYQLDVAGFFADVLANPNSYGFTNTTGTALTGNTVVPNPDQYVFWDDIHPTRIAHGMLGTVASDVLDTRDWISNQATGTWNTPGNWDPGGAPQSRWIVRLSNSSAAARSATVGSNSTVRRIDMSGAGAAMRLAVMNGARLSVTERVRVSSGGEIGLQGGTIATPLLQNHGGTIEGFGTIEGDFEQDALGRIKVNFPTLPGDAGDILNITGVANLDGTLSVALDSGEIPLPGQTREVLGFGSFSGDVDVLNETGFAGLSFTKTYSTTSLSLTAAALGGDANLDGIVDVRDLVSLANHWFTSSNWVGGDFDQSGYVDANDLGIMARNWQAGVLGASLAQAMESVGLSGVNVPEPTAIMLAVSLLLVRRRGCATSERMPEL